MSVRSLVAAWRGRANYRRRQPSSLIAETFDVCADELEAALRDTAPVVFPVATAATRYVDSRRQGSGLWGQADVWNAFQAGAEWARRRLELAADDQPKEKSMEIVKIAAATFSFGDKRFRALYGPPNEHGGRQLVAVVDEAFVEKLEGIFEREDAFAGTSEDPASK